MRFSEQASVAGAVGACGPADHERRDRAVQVALVGRHDGECCVACGYSLAGLVGGVVCPECGTRVGVSLAEMMRAVCARDAGLLGLGMRVAAGGASGFVVMTALVVVAVVNRRSDVSMWAGALVAAAMVLAAGVVVLTTPRVLMKAGAERGRRVSRRAGVVLGVVAAAVGAELLVGGARRDGPDPLMMASACVAAPVLVAVIATATLVYLRHVALGCRDGGLARRLNGWAEVAMWCGVSGFVVMLFFAAQGLGLQLVGRGMMQAPPLLLAAACVAVRGRLAEFCTTGKRGEVGVERPEGCIRGG